MCCFIQVVHVGKLRMNEAVRLAETIFNPSANSAAASSAKMCVYTFKVYGTAAEFKKAWEYARSMKGAAMSASDKKASGEALDFYDLCEEDEECLECYVGKSTSLACWVFLFFSRSCFFRHSHVIKRPTLEYTASLSISNIVASRCSTTSWVM